jgi:hypothetical protein
MNWIEYSMAALVLFCAGGVFVSKHENEDVRLDCSISCLMVGLAAAFILLGSLFARM